MIVSIHQPAYLPWLGLVEKIALSDRFIALDDVQFNDRAFQHRTLYSTDEGPRYLTLPVHAAGVRAQRTPIRDIALADPAAMGKHYKTLAQRYGKAPGWPLVKDGLGEILHGSATQLVEVALATMSLTLGCFGVATPVTRSSTLDASGAKGALMLSLTQAVGGDVYLSGSGARAYMEPALFESRGVRVAYQDFHHPVYAQGRRGEFQPGCFALEWFLVDPQGAVDRFRASVAEARRHVEAH